MISVTDEELREYFSGKRVAVIGSGPSCLKNKIGFIDSFDVVVRVNNFKLSETTGFRTDIFYSYFGSSIRKDPSELHEVKYMICKCPDSKFIESKWHTLNDKENGVDFRYIYNLRKNWWPKPVYIPSTEEFLETFNLLKRHIPTTGFSAILKVLQYPVKELYITGFDFFESGIHNVNERWRPNRTNDPICHRPDFEKKWLIENIKKYPITLDKQLSENLRHALRV